MVIIQCHFYISHYGYIINLLQNQVVANNFLTSLKVENVTYIIGSAYDDIT